MSRFVVATAYGGPEVLEIVDEELPKPGPGEIQVDVVASGVNPADAKSYTGAFGIDPSKIPLRIGFEAAGIVTAVGDEPNGPSGVVRVGEEVILFRISGGYAEQLVVPADKAVPKPNAMPWDEAAGLMLAGATAVHTLAATNVGDGDRVLIHAAAGGVGLMAVQLAVHRGARVLGTASRGHHDRLRQLGAEPVEYGEGLADRVKGPAPEGIDAAIDLVGTDEAIEVSLELVSDLDRIASIAGFQKGAEAGIKLLGNGPGADPGTDIRNEARLQLVDLVDRGLLRVFVSERFPLDEVMAAHRSILDGHGSGKIVLTARAPGHVPDHGPGHHVTG